MIPQRQDPFIFDPDSGVYSILREIVYRTDEKSDVVVVFFVFMMEILAADKGAIKKEKNDTYDPCFQIQRTL
jgi:hypothetical protein